jgi:hypothetical protein
MRGYSFDACSPALLIKFASVKDKRITFPGGASYRMLVLPDIPTFTPELLKKIEALVKSGATVIGIPPKRSPSLSNFPDCDREVSKLAETVWGTAEGTKAVNSYFYYGGTAYWPNRDISYDSLPDRETHTTGKYPKYSIIESLLNTTGLKPDFRSEGSYRYHHRSLPDREIYFISNRTGEERDDSCFFRSGTSNAEIWDPLTGRISSVRNISKTLRETGLKIKLAPYGSCLAVFYKPETINVNDTLIIGESENEAELKVITGKWEVNIPETEGGPGIVVFDSLYSWHLAGDERIKHFSGVAEYSTVFNISLPERQKGKTRYLLGTGEIHGMGQVFINGKDAGIVWCDPWKTDVTAYLKNGKNELRIRVANLWVNRLIGDEKKQWNGPEGGKWPDWLQEGGKKPEGRYSFTTHRYYKADDTLVAGGLTGPVTITMHNSSSKR